MLHCKLITYIFLTSLFINKSSIYITRVRFLVICLSSFQNVNYKSIPSEYRGWTKFFLKKPKKKRLTYNNLEKEYLQFKIEKKSVGIWCLQNILINQTHELKTPQCAWYLIDIRKPINPLQSGKFKKKSTVNKKKDDAIENL